MEDWRDIPNYIGLYQASRSGKIRSLITNKILSPGISRVSKYKRPYYFLNLYDGSGILGRKTTAVHRAVAAAFLGEWSTTEKLVDHINGDSLDNRVENLRYATKSENCLNRCRLTGINFHKASNKWQSRATKNKCRFSLGLFLTKQEAIDAKQDYLRREGLS